MLIDQQNANVFTLLCELIEGRFDSRVIGFRVHNEEVLLRVWRRRDVLQSTQTINSCPQSSSYSKRDAYADTSQKQSGY